jgi:hypothetical protein
LLVFIIRLVLLRDGEKPASRYPPEGSRYSERQRREVEHDLVTLLSSRVLQGKVQL